jgi:hypothetical protein
MGNFATKNIKTHKYNVFGDCFQCLMSTVNYELSIIFSF